MVYSVFFALFFCFPFEYFISTCTVYVVHNTWSHITFFSILIPQRYKKFTLFAAEVFIIQKLPIAKLLGIHSFGRFHLDYSRKKRGNMQKKIFEILKPIPDGTKKTTEQFPFKIERKIKNTQILQDNRVFSASILIKNAINNLAEC